MPPLSITEATSILSAAIVVVTFLVGRSTATKTSGAEKQQLTDKLDTIASGQDDIKALVKDLDRKVDDYGDRITRIESALTGKADVERVAKVEQQLVSAFKRIDHIERNCDIHRGIGVGGSD